MLIILSGRPKAFYNSKLLIFCKTFLPVAVDRQTHVLFPYIYKH